MHKHAKAAQRYFPQNNGAFAGMTTTAKKQSPENITWRSWNHFPICSESFFSTNGVDVWRENWTFHVWCQIWLIHIVVRTTRKNAKRKGRAWRAIVSKNKKQQNHKTTGFINEPKNMALHSLHVPFTFPDRYICLCLQNNEATSNKFEWGRQFFSLTVHTVYAITLG